MNQEVANIAYSYINFHFPDSPGSEEAQPEYESSKGALSCAKTTWPHDFLKSNFKSDKSHLMPLETLLETYNLMLSTL